MSDISKNENNFSENTENMDFGNEDFSDTEEEKNSKGSVIIAIISLIAVAVIFLIFIYKDTESKNEERAVNNGMKFILKNDGTSTVEYGDKIDAIDFVKDYKGDLTVPKVDTMKVGKQKLIYTIKSGKYKKQYTKWIDVEDTQKPKLEIDADLNQTVLKGEPFEFDDTYIQASDPVDGELTPVITGKVNTNVVGVYKLHISAEDANKNRTEKTMTVHVVPEDVKNSQFDVSTGNKLDSWSQYTQGAILVRGRGVQIIGTVDQDIVSEYVKQINACPAYLLNTVDQIIIAPQNIMETQYNVNNTDEDTVIGHTQYVEDKTVIILNGSTTSGDDTVIHECAHAYDIRTNISATKEFKAIYKKEKKNENKYANTSAKEFFAYTYTEYVMKGKDELAKTCPLTADFYADNNV